MIFNEVIKNIIYRIVYLLIAFAVVITGIIPVEIQSQPLSIKIAAIDAANLPLIRIQTCITRLGQSVQRLSTSQFNVIENGVPVNARIECPDSSSINSITLVLDNSGTMGDKLGALRDAALSFIDSLRSNDEIAIIAFGATVRLVQDFTSDRNVLRTQLMGLTVAGNTPLFDASLLGVQKLVSRPGKKICIIMTDGADNASKATSEDVISEAEKNGVVLFTIGYHSDNEDLLIKMASRTGGKFFPAFGLQDFAVIFNTIASEIISRCCVITYVADNCRDSLRFIHIELNAGNERAIADTSYSSPSRPDTVHLRVIAPPEIGPNQSAFVYIAFEPNFKPGMYISFKFRLHYDQNLLTVSPVTPITLGTITQNTFVNLKTVRPGVLEFSAMMIQPTIGAGNLVGVRMKSVLSDSSRPVPLIIEDPEFSAGCPNIVFSTSDTINVCQCKKSVETWLDTLITYSEQQLKIDVHIQDTALTKRTLFISDIFYDEKILTPIRVETNGTKSSSGNISWNVSAPGVLHFYSLNSFFPQSSNILCSVIFQIQKMRSAQVSKLALPSVKVYEQCCPLIGITTSAQFLVDGICNKISVKKTNHIVLKTSIPHPVQSTGTVSFEIRQYDREGNDESLPIQLRIVDAMGREITLLVNEYLQSGLYIVPFQTANFSAGIYYFILQSNDEIVTAPFVVVK